MRQEILGRADGHCISVEDSVRTFEEEEEEEEAFHQSLHWLMMMTNFRMPEIAGQGTKVKLS